MHYHHWNYDCGSWLPEQTQHHIIDYFTSSPSEKVMEYLYWLHDNHPQFSFQFRDFIFCRVVEYKHFCVSSELLDNKIYHFDNKISQACAFRLALSFDKEVFDYWLSHVHKLNRHEQSSVYKKFWEEFLCFQFQCNEFIDDNMPHLEYVFDKAPFYIQSDYDMLNSYFIGARSDFFNNRLDNLTKQLRFTILKNIAILCGQHYPHFDTTFKEEFQKYPDMITIFEKSVMHNKLSKALPVKNITLKSKI